MSMEALKKAIADANDKITSLDNQLTQSENNRLATEAHIKTIATKIQQEFKKTFGEQLFSLRKSVWDTTQIQSTQTEFLELINKDYIEGASLRIQSLESNTEKKEELIKHNKERILTTEKTLFATENQVTNLTCEIQKNQQEISSLQTQLDELRKNNLHLGADYSDIENKLLNSITAVQAITTERDQLKLEIQNLIKTGISLRAERDNLIQRQLDTYKDIDNGQNKIQFLKNKLSDSEEIIDNAYKDQAKLKDRISELQKQLSAESLKVRDLEDQVQAFIEPNQLRNHQKNTSIMTEDYFGTREKRQTQSLYNEFVNAGYSGKRNDQCNPNEELLNPQKVRTNQEKRNSIFDIDTESVTMLQPRSLDVLMTKAMKIIPIFDGAKHANTATELEKYLVGCKMLQETARMGEDEKLLQCYVMRLNGDAFQVINGSGCETFRDLRNVLIKKFKTKITYEECMENIRTCKQQPEEETRAFLSRAEKLYKLACRLIDTKYSDPKEFRVITETAQTSTMSSIRLGLTNSDIRKHLLSTRHENLEDLIDEIERYEKGLIEIQGRVSVSTENIHVIVDPFTEIKTMLQMNHTELTDKMNQQQSTLTTHGRQISSMDAKIREFEQFRSRMERNKEKRSNPFATSNWKSQTEDNNFNGKLLECYKCHKTGHFARECQAATCFYCKKANHDFNICAAKYHEEKAKTANQNSQYKEGGN